MKKLVLASMAAVALLATSCAVVSTPVGYGGLYTSVTAGDQVTSNNVGRKVGKAKASNILGIIAIGDASTEVAAKTAGIKKISHIDSKKTSVLGIFATYEVMVYGE